MLTSLYFTPRLMHKNDYAFLVAPSYFIIPKSTKTNSRVMRFNKNKCTCCQKQNVPTSKSLSILFCFKYNMCILAWQSIEPHYMVPKHYRLTIYIISFHCLRYYCLYVHIQMNELELVWESNKFQVGLRLLIAPSRLETSLASIITFVCLVWGCTLSIIHALYIYIYLMTIFNFNCNLQFILHLNLKCPLQF